MRDIHTSRARAALARNLVDFDIHTMQSARAASERTPIHEFKHLYPFKSLPLSWAIRFRLLSL